LSMKVFFLFFLFLNMHAKCFSISHNMEIFIFCFLFFLIVCTAKLYWHSVTKTSSSSRLLPWTSHFIPVLLQDFWHGLSKYVTDFKSFPYFIFIIFNQRYALKRGWTKKGGTQQEVLTPWKCVDVRDAARHAPRLLLCLQPRPRCHSAFHRSRLFRNVFVKWMSFF